MSRKNILKSILESLMKSVDDDECGISDEEYDEVIAMLSDYMDKGVFLSKYEACRLLGIERSRFDDLVRDGRLPRGTAKPGAKELFWKKKDIINYKNKYKNGQSSN